MTKAEFDDKVSKLEKAIASPSTPDKQKESFKALLKKLRDTESTLVEGAAKKEPKKAAKKAHTKAEPKERVYIEFLNKDKGHKKDKKYFDSYADAKAWAIETMDKFDPDIIKYETVEPAKAEPKAKAKKEPKAKAAPKKPAASTSETDYDCDNLIEKEKELKRKRKAAAEKRASEPKKTPATKNKEAIEKVAERVSGNVMKRVEKGEVKKPELEKLITATEDLLTKLKAALKKV